MPERFSGAPLEEIARARHLWIRAGTEHRFIGIWVVVVRGRVFVRSWNVKPGGWHGAFLREKCGAVRLSKDGREIPVRTIRTRSESLKADVDRAYAEKYTTPASLTYVKGFRAARRRDTTMELVPR